MSKICRDFTDSSKAWYTVEIVSNEIFLNLDSLEFKCAGCDKSQYIDLSPVPAGKIPVSCSNCNKKVLTLEEDDFQIQAIPIDEVYDHVPFLGMYTE